MRVRVAVVGVGAMGRGIVQVVQRSEDMEVIAIADKNPKALEKTSRFLPKDALITTDSMEAIDRKPDVLVEATTSIFEAALLVRQALEKKIHVILMNAEVDQLYGRLLARIAKKNGVILTSDAGDQHGVLLRLIEDIKTMGFEVVMAGNNKGFLNRYANPESIKEEAAKRRLTPKQCAAYTDGTKLAIEMALVANALNLNLLKNGMTGPRTENIYDALNIFDLEKAREVGGVVDYVLGAKPGGSVFVIGYSDDPEDRFYMNYYKMGKGPYYLFLRPYHLCHFETPIAIKRVIKYREPILTQKKRVLEVVAYAKTDLKPGTKLDGIGGYHLYGLLEKPGNLPIGLSEGATLIKGKKKDEPIGWDDIEFPEDDPRIELWEEQKRYEET